MLSAKVEKYKEEKKACESCKGQDRKLCWRPKLSLMKGGSRLRGWKTGIISSVNGGRGYGWLVARKDLM